MDFYTKTLNAWDWYSTFSLVATLGFAFDFFILFDIGIILLWCNTVYSIYYYARAIKLIRNSWQQDELASLLYSDSVIGRLKKAFDQKLMARISKAGKEFERPINNIFTLLLITGGFTALWINLLIK